MKTLIIIFELIQPNYNYTKVVQKIHTYHSWARLSSSAYLIIVNTSPVAVRDNLLPLLRPGDRLFVGTCPVPAAWQGMPDDVAKWILENQPKHS